VLKRCISCTSLYVVPMALLEHLGYFIRNVSPLKGLNRNVRIWYFDPSRTIGLSTRKMRMTTDYADGTDREMMNYKL
jgi:hypothetical protein